MPTGIRHAPADPQKRLDDWIHGQPSGVVVARMDADGTAFAQAGRFDGDSSPAVAPNTQVEKGSITKVFTALLLAESESSKKSAEGIPA